MKRPYQKYTHVKGADNRYNIEAEVWIPYETDTVTKQEIGILVVVENRNKNNNNNKNYWIYGIARKEQYGVVNKRFIDEFILAENICEIQNYGISDINNKMKIKKKRQLKEEITTEYDPKIPEIKKQIIQKTVRDHFNIPIERLCNIMYIQ